ncbi:SBBP repeat-containing protein [Spirosoma terrae]|uniref:T9SS type A sorting domain-containing protein n=1 Tax=Spirosoma terrae TaxID=1968276 RepID=A0A6L9LH20_9BACT|nr:SBBP repeat-containing protein [Spirosoma terrae]NDU99007.1 T9SS type A sorting domain-containing protein [Spirosoma terrae]
MKQLLLLLCLFISIDIHAQPPVEWAVKGGGSDQDYGTDVATDASGNVYVTGYFLSNQITFGNVVLNRVSPAGKGDVFLVKYDPSGNVIWARNAGRTDTNHPKVAVDPTTNSVYWAGEFAGPSITFGTITLTNPNYSTQSFHAIESTFLVKLDANGNTMWAKSGNGKSYAYPKGITVDASGNVYMAGAFGGNQLTFDGVSLTSTDDYASIDAYLVKYDTNGNVVWGKSFGSGYSQEQTTGVASDATGNVYITGLFENQTISFGNITLTNSMDLVNSGTYRNSEVFIAKFDGNGNTIWAKKASGVGNKYPTSIAVDATGKLYITGQFISNTIQFDNITLSGGNPQQYANNIFLAQYDLNGNAIWAKSAGEAQVNKVLTDASGSVYTTGFFRNSLSFGAITLSSPNNNYNAFINKYDGTGNVIWAKSEGGSGYDGGYSLATYNNALYLTGIFTGTIPVGTTSLTSSGEADVLQVKYDSKALPVNLVYFTAQLVNKQALLTWKTAYEKNNKGFEVQRSIDMKSFETIGLVSGREQGPGSYSFIDEIPKAGVNYYRLKQIDWDGTYSYSPARAVVTSSMVTLYPNPASDWIFVESEDTKGELIITDMTGKIVVSTAVNGRGQQFYIGHIPAGKYLYQLNSTRGAFIKE